MEITSNGFGFFVDTLSVFFLTEGEQTADAVMARLIAFVNAARQSLDFAVYDMRLSNPLTTALSSALHGRAAAGVQIRFFTTATNQSE